MRSRICWAARRGEALARAGVRRADRRREERPARRSSTGWCRTRRDREF
jgi:hypothetical protein